ncbi:DUF334 domain-containing protein, partial [Staphylococcus epidermidis]|nr:DUF334 domain-containing protein [Staphylococcus epidermidis]
TSSKDKNKLIVKYFGRDRREPENERKEQEAITSKLKETTKDSR